MEVSSLQPPESLATVPPVAPAADPPFAGAVPACAVDAVEDGEGLRVESSALPAPVAVFRVGEEFFALDDACTHQDASLADGWVEDCAVECPLHASCFDLRTGAVSGPPAKVGVRAHRVEVVAGVVWVEA